MSFPTKRSTVVLHSASIPVLSRISTPALLGLQLWVFGLILLLLYTNVFAKSVSLAWDPSTDTQIAGYKLYYGFGSGQYSTNVNVGMATTAAVSGLTDAKVYYFATTAYDLEGNESVYSNELSYDLSTVDSDGDGLKDWDELSLYRTDPDRSDTDGDGLSDGDEVNVHRTDPLQADTDGDGSNDGQEVAKGSNPTDPGSVPVSDDVVFAVNAGGPQYVGADEAVYQADSKFIGGASYTTTATIGGTIDGRLYQSERYGNFSYAIPVANAAYDVTLKFAEIYFTSVGQRVFNVSIEGKTVLSNLDIVAKVGPRTAYDVTLPVTVSDGVLNINFSSVVDNAKISGIKVEPKQVVFAVNAGGSEYMSADGTSYQADAKFVGGSAYVTNVSISGTTDDRVYQSERYGNFSYNIPITNGDYEVTLKFAEVYWTSVGQRVFKVLLEGKTVLSQVDIIAQVGPNKAYDVTLPVRVTDGVLNIKFTSVVDYAKVSGIVVRAK